MELAGAQTTGTTRACQQSAEGKGVWKEGPGPGCSLDLHFLSTPQSPPWSKPPWPHAALQWPPSWCPSHLVCYSHCKRVTCRPHRSNEATTLTFPVSHSHTEGWTPTCGQEDPEWLTNASYQVLYASDWCHPFCYWKSQLPPATGPSYVLEKHITFAFPVDSFPWSLLKVPQVAASGKPLPDIYLGTRDTRSCVVSGSVWTLKGEFRMMRHQPEPKQKGKTQRARNPSDFKGENTLEIIRHIDAERTENGIRGK